MDSSILTLCWRHSNYAAEFAVRIGHGPDRLNHSHHLSPGTPPELVQILRDAMEKTFKDPGFRQDFMKPMGREATPLTGEEVQKRYASCHATRKS